LVGTRKALPEDPLNALGPHASADGRDEHVAHAGAFGRADQCAHILRQLNAVHHQCQPRLALSASRQKSTGWLRERDNSGGVDKSEQYSITGPARTRIGTAFEALLRQVFWPCREVHGAVDFRPCAIGRKAILQRVSSLRKKPLNGLDHHGFFRMESTIGSERFEMAAPVI